MCGIAGVVGTGPVDHGLLTRMAGRLAHRGPDDSGTWGDDGAGVGLAHRRLSIVDLSPLGHQPMPSRDERWLLSYNGEIYNHLEIRRELEREGAVPAGTWRGHSDSETLIEAIAQWGVKPTLQRCVGMFALAVWDRKERVLHLARDRFGEKPLYYGWAGTDFVFASELKALTVHPRFSREVDRRALRLFVSRTYIPAPLSIYRDTYKLEPGCILSATSEALRKKPSGPLDPGDHDGIKVERYWSYRDTVGQGLSAPIRSEDEALEGLEAVLATAIKGQAVADVPVGAFLSGGIDSSTIVALYQKHSTQNVRTFTIGFEEAGFNEAEHAKAVAEYLGTEHHERYVTVNEAQALIPALPQMYDEPFADSSQIPTHLVSRFAREQVTVALSGDAGDELFGGYNRYVSAARMWGHLKRLPGPVRALAGRGLGSVPPSAWNGLVGLMPGPKRMPQFGTKVQKAFQTMGVASSLEGVFNTFLDEWSAERSPVLGGEDGGSDCAFDLDVGQQAPDAVRMMYCDARSYLPDDILCKVDRAAMAVSLETRVPFLDHRVAEFAAHIPLDFKIKGGKGKHILRRLLYSQAPRHLFERPKTGFSIPVGEWIRGPLRPWAEALLDRQRLSAEGWFDPDIVHRRWQQHLRGDRDSTPALWAILMFQAWLDEQAAS